MNPLIFLDMDGVILPFPASKQKSSCGAIFADYTLEALSFILESVPNIKVVLSSTWRSQENLIREILDSFRLYGVAFGSPLLHITEFHDLTNPDYHGERQHEIHKWLEHHKFPSIWVAIDDEPLLEGKANEERRPIFEGHVVQTQSHIGLDMAKAREAVDLLTTQLKTTGQVR